MIKNFNFKNNQRLDISHLKMIESSITDDLQVITDNIIAGNSTIIIRGFTIPVTDIIGNPATSLQMTVADSALIHTLSGEDGSLFTIPASQSPDTLNSANPRVVGSFIPSITNYIGVGLVRSIDATTAETVSILDDATKTEFSQKVPLGDVLDYRIYIQTANFDSTSNICPVAIIRLGTNCEVISISDARPLAFRLGVGGTSPSATTPYYSLPDRTEAPVSYTGTGSSPFTGGDKNITSLRDWMAVIERRIWEGSGGAYWYSPSSVNDVRPAYSDAVFSETLKNWYLDGTDLLWQGLRFIFSNGINSSYYCTVADQTTALAGLTNLSNGECLYIDIDRTQNATNLTVCKDSFAAMPQPTIPGSRLIIAWKNFDEVYTYGESAPVNSGVLHASPYVLGVVKIYEFPTGITEPVCPTVDSEGKALATGLCSSGQMYQTLNIGTTQYDKSITIGVDTKISGTLKVSQISGSGSATGNLIVKSTSDINPGIIHFGASGDSYLDQTQQLLIMPTIRGGDVSGENLTLLSTLSEDKGYIHFGPNGASFGEADDMFGVNYVSGGSYDGACLTLSSTSNATKGLIKIGNYGVLFDEVNSTLQVPTLRGSSSSGGDLILESTFHGTKGLIRFGENGTTIYSEAEDRLGIGTESPAEKLHIVGNSLFSGQVDIKGNVTVNGDLAISSLTQDLMVRADSSGYITTAVPAIYYKLDTDITLPSYSYDFWTFDSETTWGETVASFAISATFLVQTFDSDVSFSVILKNYPYQQAGDIIHYEKVWLPQAGLHTVTFFTHFEHDWSTSERYYSVSIGTSASGTKILHESSSGADDNTTNLIIYQL
jgi:hypothetical protein